MKYILLIIVLFMSVFLICANQDQLNVRYLGNLDAKFIETADIIISFNESIENVETKVSGAEEFSTYLMNLTIQISSLRKTVEITKDYSVGEREEAIRLMMSELKPQPLEPVLDVSDEQDSENKKYLEERYIKLQKQLTAYRAKIIREETLIKESLKITQNYLSLHNKHFIYQLVNCFMADYISLSKTNRQYLIDLVNMIDNSIYHQKL